VSARHYGPIVQNSWVVADLNAGIADWTHRMRVGPFFRFPKIVFETGHYRGRAMLPDYDAAVAYSGELMIELIQPNGPSIFQDFLDAGGVGVQHLCAMSDDLPAATAEIEARGGIAVQGGTFADGSRLTYFDLGGPAPSILEIAELKPDVLALFAAIKAAGASWNGRDATVSF
jgi:hypothetical protein